MQSLLQQVGGMCCGSVVERVKMRRRQELHMRCLQGKRADLEMGISSDKQVIHSTLSWSRISMSRGTRVTGRAHCRSGFGGLVGAAGLGGTGSPNIEPRILDGRLGGLFPFAMEDARSTFSRAGGDVGEVNDWGRA